VQQREPAVVLGKHVGLAHADERLDAGEIDGRVREEDLALGERVAVEDRVAAVLAAGGPEQQRCEQDPTHRASMDRATPHSLRAAEAVPRPIRRA
jgi:hypothetical protein